LNVRPDGLLRCGLVAGVPLLAAALAFGHWTATTPWAWIRCAAVALALFYLPGRLIVERAQLAASATERVALSVVLGLVATGTGYAILARWRLGWLLWLAPPLALAGLVRGRVRTRAAPERSHGVEAAALGIVATLACLPFAIIPGYYRNLARLSDGGLSYYPFADVILHVSLARSLLLSVPPEVPFQPGQPLVYHHAMDLVTALLVELGGISVLDACLRFVPTLLMLALVLSVFCFSRAWLASGGGALLATVLVVLGEDLSFLPGLWGGTTSTAWAVQYLGMPNVVSLYGMNPILPALVLLFSGLLAILRYRQEGRLAWLLTAGTLLGLLVETKVFTAAHLLLALGLTGLWRWLVCRESALLKVAALASALAVPLALRTLLAAGARASFSLEAWPYVPAAFLRSGLGDSWPGRVSRAVFAGDPTPVEVAGFLAVAVPLYLLAALGARALALPLLARAALHPRAADAPRLLLGVFAALGALLSLTVAITPAGHGRLDAYNDSVWFLLQAKWLLWVVAVEQLLRFRVGRGMRAALASALLALSLPSSLQYLQFQWRQPLLRLGEPELALMRFLDQRFPGRTVLARPDVAEAVLTLTRCRAPAFTVHPVYFVQGPELAQGPRRLEAFWSEWSAGRLERSVPRAYGAEAIVVDVRLDGAGPAQEPALQTLFEQGRFRVVAFRDASAPRLPSPPGTP
jgi:hypothetical protein